MNGDNLINTCLYSSNHAELRSGNTAAKQPKVTVPGGVAAGHINPGFKRLLQYTVRRRCHKTGTLCSFGNIFNGPVSCTSVISGPLCRSLCEEQVRSVLQYCSWLPAAYISTGTSFTCMIDVPGVYVLFF